MYELMLEGLKTGGEDVMLNKDAMGELGGKQKPILELLYSGMQQKAACKRCLLSLRSFCKVAVLVKH